MSGLACGPDRETLQKEKARKQAAETLRAVADKADAEVAKEEAELARVKATEAMYERKSWAKLMRDGTLGPFASIELKARADAGGQIEAIIRDGSEIKKFGEPLSALLNEAAVDARAIDPFAVKAEESRAATAIAAMARVERVDGIELGFSELGRVDPPEAEITVWGYLVVWFHQGAVVGFVVHSKQALELDAVVAETSRLVELMRAELP